MSKKILSLILSLIMIVSMTGICYAENEDNQTKSFLSLGAEQNSDERTKVLSLLNIANEELDKYNVLYVTNDDEHHYLGSYMSKSLIGTRALSSVLITPASKGTGITVSCININYCTPGMYRNALITAGVTDAYVEVVAPYPLPGTAALVGAMKSFEVMTGSELSDDAKDAATNELVATGEIGKSIGDTEKAEELIGLVKQEVIENGVESKEDIETIVDKAANSLSVNLSDEDRVLISQLMQKISSLDLNIDSIKTQAKDLYDKLSSINIDPTVWDSIKQFFANLWNSIVEFFNNLFSGASSDNKVDESTEPTSEEQSSDLTTTTATTTGITTSEETQSPTKETCELPTQEDMEMQPTQSTQPSEEDTPSDITA